MEGLYGGYYGGYEGDTKSYRYRGLDYGSYGHVTIRIILAAVSL